MKSKLRKSFESYGKWCDKNKTYSSGWIIWKIFFKERRIK